MKSKISETRAIIDELKVGDIIIDNYRESVYKKWGWKNPTEKAKLRVVEIRGEMVAVSKIGSNFVSEVIFNPPSSAYRKEVAA